MKRINNKKGFTLIEMIVALGIFGVVAVIAVGALVQIVGANRKAQAMQAAVTNVHFAIESMVREIRVGSKITCYTNSRTSFTEAQLDKGLCPNGGRSIAFVSDKIAPDNSNCRLIIAYKFEGEDLQKAEESNCGGGIFNSDFSSLLDGINVTILKHELKFRKNTTDEFPIGFIYLSGYAGTKIDGKRADRERSYFDVQTAFSQRLEE